MAELLQQDLAQTQDLAKSLDEGYKSMRQDQQRENEALEWTKALSKDITNEGE